MTKKQYEEVVKSILEYTNEVLKKAKTDEERIHILMCQNMQIQGITDEFNRTRTNW